jgi:uncharacterized membrane protein YebE (DUF533 family)
MAEEGEDGVKLLKGALIGLGALTALGLGLALLAPMVKLGLLAGAGYLGYRLVAGKGKKSVAGSARHRALPQSGDDFERRMRELDAIEKQLDAEIRRNS